MATETATKFATDTDELKLAPGSLVEILLDSSTAAK